MSRENALFIGFECTCQQCRRKFFKPTTEWAYMERVKTQQRSFCSWGCIQAWRRKHDKSGRLIKTADLSRRQIKEQAVRKEIVEAVQRETTVRGLLMACLDAYHEMRMFAELSRATGISTTTIYNAYKSGDTTTYTADRLLRGMGVEVGGTCGTV